MDEDLHPHYYNPAGEHAEMRAYTGITIIKPGNIYIDEDVHKHTIIQPANIYT